MFEDLLVIGYEKVFNRKFLITSQFQLSNNSKKRTWKEKLKVFLFCHLHSSFVHLFIQIFNKRFNFLSFVNCFIVFCKCLSEKLKCRIWSLVPRITWSDLWSNKPQSQGIKIFYVSTCMFNLIERSLFSQILFFDDFYFCLGCCCCCCRLHQVPIQVSIKIQSARCLTTVLLVKEVVHNLDRIRTVLW